MNITLAIDEQVAHCARQAAQAMGKSLNQVVRDYLEQLAGSEQLESALEDFRACTASTPGRLKGWTFNREDLQAGRPLRAFASSTHSTPRLDRKISSDPLDRSPLDRLVMEIVI